MYQQDDSESVHVTAHRMKSASGNLAGLVLSTLCTKLEEMGKNQVLYQILDKVGSVIK